MKHILNNLSEEEKNAIREQHAGGMKVMTENFSKLIKAKLGDSKPLVNEQVKISQPSTDDLILFINVVNVNRFKHDPKGSDSHAAYISNDSKIGEFKGKPLSFRAANGATIFFDKNGKRINAQDTKGIVTFRPGHQDFDKLRSWLKTNTNF